MLKDAFTYLGILIVIGIALWVIANFAVGRY